MTLNFTWSEQRPPIRSVTIFYMKSYGPRWENSTATVSLRSLVASPDASESSPSGSQHLTTLFGFHSKKTSETFHEEIELPRSDEGWQGFYLDLNHTAGETFKVTGIALCS